MRNKEKPKQNEKRLKKTSEKTNKMKKKKKGSNQTYSDRCEPSEPTRAEMGQSATVKYKRFLLGISTDDIQPWRFGKRTADEVTVTLESPPVEQTHRATAYGSAQLCCPLVCPF